MTVTDLPATTSVAAVPQPAVGELRGTCGSPFTLAGPTAAERLSGVWPAVPSAAGTAGRGRRWRSSGCSSPAGQRRPAHLATNQDPTCRSQRPEPPDQRGSSGRRRTHIRPRRRHAPPAGAPRPSASAEADARVVAYGALDGDLAFALGSPRTAPASTDPCVPSSSSHRDDPHLRTAAAGARRPAARPAPPDRRSLRRAAAHPTPRRVPSPPCRPVGQAPAGCDPQRRTRHHQRRGPRRRPRSSRDLEPQHSTSRASTSTGCCVRAVAPVCRSRSRHAADTRAAMHVARWMPSSVKQRHV